MCKTTEAYTYVSAIRTLAESYGWMLDEDLDDDGRIALHAERYGQEHCFEATDVYGLQKVIAAYLDGTDSDDTSDNLESAVYAFQNELMKIRTYTIPVEWKVMGNVTCYGRDMLDAAHNLETADSELYPGGVALPDDSDYADGTFTPDWQYIKEETSHMTRQEFEKALDNMARDDITGAISLEYLENNNQPRVFFTPESSYYDMGTVFIVAYNLDAEEVMLSVHEVSAKRFAARYREMAEYLNKDNATTFFLEMEENCDAHTDISRDDPSWEMVSEMFWNNSGYKNFSLDTLKNIIANIHICNKTKEV